MIGTSSTILLLKVFDGNDNLWLDWKFLNVIFLEFTYFLGSIRSKRHALAVLFLFILYIPLVFASLLLHCHQRNGTRIHL